MASKTKVTPQKEEMLEKNGGRIRQLENQKAPATTIGIKTIEKTILRIFGSCTFPHKPQSRPNEAIVFAFRFFSRSGPHLAEA